MRVPTWVFSGDRARCPAIFDAIILLHLTGCSAVVARTAGGREVAGSIPVTPTKVLMVILYIDNVYTIVYRKSGG